MIKKGDMRHQENNYYLIQVLKVELANAGLTFIFLCEMTRMSRGMQRVQYLWLNWWFGSCQPS